MSIVGLLAPPDFQALDLTGPVEIFLSANRILHWAAMQGRAHPPGPSGDFYSVLHLQPTDFLTSTVAIDVLLVAGPRRLADLPSTSAFESALRRTTGKIRVIGAVGTGVFVLASAGLLDGRKATTTWRWSGELAKRRPGIRVQSRETVVRDGQFYTSAGGFAASGLGLAMLADDHGRAVMIEVCRDLLICPGWFRGQSQFVPPGPGLFTDAGTEVARIHPQIASHLNDDLSVEALARNAGLPPRTFARRFVQEFGTTPAKYVERARTECARRLLETQDIPESEIAERCGFSGQAALRRAFMRLFRVTPSEYLDCFANWIYE